MSDVSSADPHTGCPNRSGTLLAGRYRLQRRIAVGGMGEVYAASHIEIPKRYAIKLLRPEFTRDAPMQARFRREAETAARLTSEHIVDIADFGTGEDGSMYLVMELLEGVDLRRFLARRGRLRVPDACELMAQACAGVTVAHRNGIVHRDLKPENLFLTQRASRAVLKVLDFGIAKLRNQSLGTESGKLLGTLGYMPPEQIRGDASVDERADVYALGAILYESLTGELPHPGEGSHEIISHVLFEPALPLRERNSEVPEELARIVHKALSHDPEQRFSSADEFAAALAGFARAETLLPIEGSDSAESLTDPARPSEPNASDLGRAKSIEPTGTKARRRRIYLGLGAACGLLLGGLFWYWRPRVLAPRPSEIAVTPAEVSSEAPPAPHAATVLVSEQVSSLDATASDAATPVVPLVPPPAASAAPLERHVKRRVAANKRAEHPLAEPPNTVPASISPSTIEVQRGDRTIVFKRTNPLRAE